MNRLLVCAPLRIEARAVRRGLGPAGDVRRTGYGPARAESAAAELRTASFGMLAVAGTGGGLSASLQPGDLVVASRVTGGAAEISCPSAPLLAGELRRAGLRAVAGPVVSTPRLVRGADRERLAAGGALAADLESAGLLTAAADRPAIVVRAVSDTAARPLGPATLAGGAAALRSLRQAGPALARWAEAAGRRKVILAGPRSFCAGVERAIEIVERALERHGQPVYVRKQIVHNSRVVADLEQRGAIFVDELTEVPDGAPVVFSAHGVAPAVRAEAERRGMGAIDATCPLVSKVHAEARRFAADGYLVALIGHAGHEEVDGVVGELLDRFPAARGPGSDDICYATTNRQLAVRAIASECDLVLVAGSANSSNSRRLVEVAERDGTPAYLIDGPEDIELGWLAGAGTIGLTAGASAPPAVVEEIVSALRGLGPVEVTERVVATENIRFGLPKEVRQA
jgi:4-hydroxy-3-methylbut-2-enyl diphosphate reductase